MLEGLVVIELASVLAGPAVGQFFSELGAEVLKIENAKTGGDVTRSWKLASESKDKADSAYFRSVNYNKQSHFLDLTTVEDQQIVHKLIREADVVISNFPSHTAEKLNMTAATIGAINPSIVFAQLDAFPASMGKRPAYDIVLQAESGFLSMTGTESGEICRMPVALIDILAAHQLKEGILLGLIRKAKTGEGSLIRTNLYASALASLANQATNYLIGGYIPQAIGSKHPNIAPYGDIFKTLDHHYIVLAVGSDQQFDRLADLLQIEVPEELKTNKGRVVNRQALLALLGQPISNLTLEYIMDNCKSNNIPVGHIKNMKEVFETPQAQDQLLSYDDGQRSVKTVAFTVEPLR